MQIKTKTIQDLRGNKIVPVIQTFWPLNPANGSRKRVSHFKPNISDFHTQHRATSLNTDKRIEEN